MSTEKPNMRVVELGCLPQNVIELNDDEIEGLVSVLLKKYDCEFPAAIGVAGRIYIDSQYGYRALGGVVQQFLLEVGE